MSVLGPCAPFPHDAATVAGIPGLEPGFLIRCLDCGLGQRQPCPEESELPKLYANAETDALQYQPDANAAWVVARKFLSRRWRDDEPRCVLDVGCHTGLFLSMLAPAWRRFGIEGAPAPRDHAVREHGVELIGERIESVQPSWLARFDAVTMFDVAEHLRDPARGLANAIALLRPGGFLLLGTADLDAWTWKVARGRHWYLQTPQHLSVLSRRFVERVATDNGGVLDAFIRIPHQLGSLSTQGNDFMETLYTALRDRGGVCRIPQRVLHSLPGLGRLRHMQAIPWSMTLRDHMFAAIRRCE
jgi:SAM-dependent methyltransferase